MRTAAYTDECRELIKKAMGSRKQNEFAEIAGLSLFNLNRLLNQENPGVPRKSTLVKIAEASEGRVTEAQILHSCGYDVIMPSDTQPELTPQEANLQIASSIKQGLEDMSGKANKFGSVQDVLETATLLRGNGKVYKYVIRDEKEYKGPGKRGAEKFVLATIVWRHQGYDARMGIAVYFCRTEGGGVIISECDFDLDSLLSVEHPDAGEMLFSIAEQGDAKYTDFPTVFICKKHVPGEAEKKLLKAIFGEETMEKSN